MKAWDICTYISKYIHYRCNDVTEGNNQVTNIMKFRNRLAMQHVMQVRSRHFVDLWVYGVKSSKVIRNNDDTDRVG